MSSKTKSSQQPSRELVAVWIVCLSALAVGARNFEQGGIGVDGPLYAFLARGMARTGEWFHLKGNVAHYIPFADHPHLGIWFIGWVFSLLPSADWSARIPGIVFYGAFLGVFFRFLKRCAGWNVAIAAVLCLWTFYRFSNFFANVYLDPGALFFGASAVFLLYEGLVDKKRNICALAGVSLALSAMVKGLTVLGFLPALAVAGVLAWNRKTRPREFAEWIGAFLLSAALVAGIYALIVEWNVPGFWQKYWFHQWTNRFSNQWEWSRLVGWRFWGSLLRDTHYLGVLLPISFVWRRPRGIDWIAWTLLFSFAAMYAPPDRVGMQYWVMLLPWPAWLLATAVFSDRKLPVARVMQVSAILALVGTFIAQFAPIRIHGREEPELALLQERVRSGRIQSLVIDMRPEGHNFTYLDKYAWYADVPVQAVHRGVSPSRPKAGSGLVVLRRDEVRQREILGLGWCLDEVFRDRAVFVDCPRFPVDPGAGRR